MAKWLNCEMVEKMESVSSLWEYGKKVERKKSWRLEIIVEE